MDVPGELAAHGHFRPFDPIDPGVSTRTAALNSDLQPWNKTQVHEMLGDGMVQFKILQDGALPDAKVGQRASSTMAVLLPSEYEVENHFQFQLYSNLFLRPDNDQCHTCL